VRLLISWVRDFVDVKAAPQEIADRLALCGFEVADLERRGVDDAVVDFEVTANRPDCLSVIGFAREIATLYDLPLRPLNDAPHGGLAQMDVGESAHVAVTVEDAELCPRYAAATADVTPGASPAWMTDRLAAAGVRPISPLVDVTNYVLMELGHPLHAFDLATLGGRQLRIRRARPGERITTLDGIDRTLDETMLVIADSDRAQAVAGVMGGSGSEVSPATRLVAFESAYFNPASVRRTSRRLGLKTEASARFERGADVNAPVLALRRAVALAHQIGVGRVNGSLIDRYPTPRAGRPLHLRRARLALLLGLAVPDHDVARILHRLGLTVEAVDDGWNVVAPTFRVDLQREVDLIEEIGRHHGFDRIEAAFPPLTVPAPPMDARIERDQMVRRVLTAAGLTEAVTFGFIEAAVAETFAAPGGTVAVANPLSAHFAALRPSLLPGLIGAVAHNRRHGRRDVAIFEIGARFRHMDGETRAAGMAWTGAAAPAHWSEKPRDVDFFDAKGAVERLCEALGAHVTIEPAAVPYFVAGQTAAVIGRQGAPLGVIGRVEPALVESRGAPRHDAVFAAELDLDRVMAEAGDLDEFVRPLPRYPSVIRDISIVVSDTLPAAIIRGTIQSAGESGRAPLVATGFFDRYTGQGVPEGHVSISVRLIFQAADRTLTDTEVQESVEAIVGALAAAHGAIQR
jgi:phenylalanyl-tRNA synthetase beta chain